VLSGRRSRRRRSKGYAPGRAEVFDSWFGLEKSTRHLWGAAVGAGVALAVLDELDETAAKVPPTGEAAEELRIFLTQPRSSIDPAVLEKARQSVAQGPLQDAGSCA